MTPTGNSQHQLEETAGSTVGSVKTLVDTVGSVKTLVDTVS
jgi:hypothetical protein